MRLGTERGDERRIIDRNLTASRTGTTITTDADARRVRILEHDVQCAAPDAATAANRLREDPEGLITRCRNARAVDDIHAIRRAAAAAVQSDRDRRAGLALRSAFAAARGHAVRVCPANPATATDGLRKKAGRTVTESQDRARGRHADRAGFRARAAEAADAHELPKSRAEAILTGAIDSIAKHLKKGSKVRIVGLGILQVRKRAARMGRNPATGEAIKIKASKKVAFRAAKELKESI